MLNNLLSIIPIILVLAVFAAGCCKSMSSVVVSGDSMFPVIENGTDVIYESVSNNDIFYNDVVVFEDKYGTEYIKTVIGLPGDIVKYDSNSIFVNDNEVEPLYYGTNGPSIEFMPNEVTVGRNEVFVVGCNFYNSIDSRIYGCVQMECIKGRVLK